MNLQEALDEVERLTIKNKELQNHAMKGWNQVSNTIRQLHYERATLQITNVHQELAKTQVALALAKGVLISISESDNVSIDSVEMAQYCLNDITEVLK